MCAPVGVYREENESSTAPTTVIHCFPTRPSTGWGNEDYDVYDRMFYEFTEIDIPRRTGF